MTNLPKPQDQELDDQLSEFTDLLLSAGNEIKMQETLNDDNLVELKKSALRMKAAVRMARPSAAVSARVRTRLLKEWKLQARQSEHLPFKRFAWPFSRLALAGSLAILLILSITTIFFPTTTPLVGTAEGLQAWAPLFIIAGITLIVIFVWFDRKH